MAQFQKRMITIVGIIMVVGVTVIFLSSGGDEKEKDKAPRFLDSEYDIDYYYYDGGDFYDYYYYSPYDYYDDLYNGKHVDIAVYFIYFL